MATVISVNESAAQFSCDESDTLLRAGLRAGLGMPYECNTGSCGTCRVELVSGEVVSNRPDSPALSERDRAKNRILACQSRPLGNCAIKVRLQDECVPVHRPRRFAAQLIAVSDITHDIREFRFVANSPAAFEPGQYALLELPGVHGARAYSMSNIADGSSEWHFQIKRVADGKATGVLFDATPVGSTLHLDGPYGMAYLRRHSPRDIICLAGGSGLSPAISIARGMAGEPALAGRTLHFFYGARTPRDVCGEDLLAALPGYGERLRYYPVVSMPELDTDRSWHGKTGFVHELALQTFGARLAEFEIYFAGPPPMTQAVQRMLVQNKVPFSQVHYDSFY